MLYLDTKNNKSKLLNEFQSNIQDIYKAYIKKCRKKSDVIATKRIDILEVKKDFSNYDIESVLSFNVCHLYQVNQKFISFSFDFPKSFDSFSDLKSKTKIHIYLFSQDNREFKFQVMGFNSFEKNCIDYLYIANNIDKFKVFEYIQSSPFVLTENLFVDLVMNDNNKELSDIVNELKKSESIFIKALESKNKYIQKRREINKKRKEHKKKNKSSANNEVLKNNLKIKELQREIQKLQNKNKELESKGKGEHITKDGANVLQSLIKEYQSDFSKLGDICIKNAYKLTDFKRNLFTTLFEI